MDTKTYFSLAEAYTAVHDEELREDLYEEYEYVDELYDEDLEDIIEEVVYDLLDEGYDFEDVEDLLKEELIGEILSEARVDMKARAARRKAADTASEKAAKEAQKRGQAVARGEKRAERVARVKGAIKGGMEKAKSAVKAGVSKARKYVDNKAREYAEKRGVLKSKSGKNALGAGSGIGSVAFKQKTPEGRREVRKAVVKDIASRAQVGAYNKGREVAQSATDTARRAKQGAKNVASRIGRGVKGAIGKAARKVAGGADKLAKRMGEDFEIWVEDLLDEGYDLSEYTWDEMADAYLNLEEARQLRPASERMARTMTASDRAKQKRERELRDAGQQALADIRALTTAERKRSSGTTSSSTQSTPDSVVRKLPTGQKVDKLAMAAKKAMGEEVEVFDVVLDFLFSEGYVETLEEAQWIMANEFDSEDIDAILEAYGEPMTKRQEYLTKKVAKMNKEKAGSAHTSITGKQNTGAALNQANKSAMQMRGL